MFKFDDKRVCLNMKKIDASKVLIGLDRKSLKFENEDFSVGRAISTILVGGKDKSFDPFKSWKIAQRFYDGGVIDLDEADLQSLRTCIESSGHQAYGNIVIGQLIEILNNARDAKDMDLKMVRGPG